MGNRLKLINFDNRGFNRGSSVIVEALWLLVRCALFSSLLPLPSGLRAIALRLFGAKIGKRVVIRSGVKINLPWRLIIGDHVWIGEDVCLLSLATITIEDNCCISQRAFLCTGSHNFYKPTFDLITKPITIKSGSWIAANCFIAPGVEVGPNSFCGAGSVVTSNVPPNQVFSGNPACFVKAVTTPESAGIDN